MEIEQDFSATVEEQIPQNRELALKHHKLSQAVENLLALEKQTRQGGDIKSTSKIAAAIVQLCWECKEWKDVNNNIIYIAKRRGQEKSVIKAMVQEAMTLLDKFPEQEISHKLELIETLRTITEGKIFVENERARLTKVLALIKEKEGKINEAADILQEIQVETYGSMEKREKTEFILAQVRLCLDCGDYIRASILSRKINKKVLQDSEVQDLKLTYYQLMIRYYSHESNFLEICHAYQAIYEIPSVKSKREQWEHYLKLRVIYAILSPYDPEQFDLLNRINLDKNLDEVLKYRALLKYFLTMELIRWPEIEKIWKPELQQLEIFQGESGIKLWSDLHKRVIAHNLRVIAGYYSKIRLDRLAQLMDLSIEDAEINISELVVSKSIYAKIDRPKGVVCFIKPQHPNDLLNDWSSNISTLLDLVENTCHLIHRETMVRAVNKSQ